MRRVVTWIVIILLILIAIVIGSRNTQLMSVNYLIAQAELRTSTFMMITLVIGFVLGLLAMSTRYIALKVKLSFLQRKLAKIKQE